MSLVFINPDILSREGAENLGRGCLSVPDNLLTRDAPLRCVSRAQDRNGGASNATTLRSLAVGMQHTWINLEGKLFVEPSRYLIARRFGRSSRRREGTSARSR